MLPIHLHFLLPVSALKNRIKLRRFLLKTAKSAGRPIQDLGIVFCTDPYLLDINKRFLDHDYFTDIITFDLSATTHGPVSAELYISVDRVKDNAQSLGTPYYMELHRVIFHGLLHLLGYSDKTQKAQKTMRAKEDELLRLYFKAS
jgi:rRNA maturation RNase YbeY